MASNPSPPNSDLLLLVSLFVWELSIALMLGTMRMKGERPFEVFLSSRPGLAFLCAAAAFLVGGTVIIHRYLENKRSPSRHFRLSVTMNLVTVVLILVTGEIAVRAGSRSFFEYEKFGTQLLTPKSWEATKLRYRQLLDQARGYVSYLVYDDLMGWTVGPSRHNTDGLYWSSSEGLRAPREGISFARIAEQTDITLVGDSFTFGEEVRYEETYGYYLEQMLGSQFRVLNFGVPGYGLDQMFLRYGRDVRVWKPKIVILGFISRDVERTLWVYPFLGDPAWDFPFSKSRIILNGGELVNINVPPLPPEAIFSRGSISELPLLEYQKEYKQSDWEKRFYHFSYLIRLFVSRCSPWSAPTLEVPEDALVSINASILKKFVRSVKQEGSIPLVVYFPRWEELKEPSLTLSLGKQVLEQAGIAYVDPTSCLLEVDPADLLYRPGRHHYSSQGNAAVAKCLVDVVRQVLGKASVG